MERKNALMECVRPLKEDCRCVAKYIHSIGGPDACDDFARMLIQAIRSLGAGRKDRRGQSPFWKMLFEYGDLSLNREKK
jgi:hypothetical protein